jgi:hypothetical protein
MTGKADADRQQSFLRPTLWHRGVLQSRPGPQKRTSASQLLSASEI